VTDPAAAEGPAGQPLEDIIVADLTRHHPGGYLTRILCDLGAEVWKIEPPQGSRMRAPGPGADYSWVTLQHSMRSMILDLRHERAGEVMRAIAGCADVVVESHPLGRLDADGIGYEQLSAVNPRLIWCSLTPYGLIGPDAGNGGHEINFLARSGVLGLITPDGQTPTQPPLMIAASQAGLWGAIGVLAALEQRHRTGLGRLIDASITDATMWLTSQEVTRSAQGASAWPDSTAGRTSYLCADGRWVSIASIEPRTWRSLCLGLGLDDLAEAVEGRPVPDDEVRGRLAEAFSTAPAQHWVDTIEDANITVTSGVGELASDPHFRERGSIVEIDRGERTETVVAPPLRFAGSNPSSGFSAPPEAGEAADEILLRAGLTPADIDDLRRSGALT
jgi:crotonobetainyl-CoA:carnitine CoA-transferase CaiB-like acyl-CoA transferase